MRDLNGLALVDSMLESGTLTRLGTRSSNEWIPYQPGQPVTKGDPATLQALSDTVALAPGIGTWLHKALTALDEQKAPMPWVAIRGAQVRRSNTGSRFRDQHHQVVHTHQRQTVWRMEGKVSYQALLATRAMLEVYYDASSSIPSLPLVEQIKLLTTMMKWPSEHFEAYIKYCMLWPLAKYMEQDKYAEMPSRPQGFDGHPLIVSGKFRRVLSSRIISRGHKHGHKDTRNFRMFIGIKEEVKKALADVSPEFVDDCYRDHHEAMESPPNGTRNRLRGYYERIWANLTGTIFDDENFRYSVHNPQDPSCKAHYERRMCDGGGRDYLLNEFYGEPRSFSKFIHDDNRLLRMINVRGSCYKKQDIKEERGFESVDVGSVFRLALEEDAGVYLGDSPRCLSYGKFCMPTQGVHNLRTDAILMRWGTDILPGQTNDPEELVHLLRDHVGDSYSSRVDSLDLARFGDTSGWDYIPDQIHLGEITTADNQYVYDLVSLFQALDGNQSLNKCEVYCIPEANKGRTITKSEAAPAYLAKQCQKHMHHHIREIEQIKAVGKPLDVHMLEGMFKRTDEFEEKFGVAFGLICSGDYKAATDSLEISQTTDAFEAYLSKSLGMGDRIKSSKSPYYPEDESERKWREKYSNILRKVLYHHEVHYPPYLDDLETVDQQNGQLMGSVLSFPILCLVNLAAYWSALEKYLGWVKAENAFASKLRMVDKIREMGTFGEEFVKGIIRNGRERPHEGQPRVRLELSELPVLINGDDILFKTNTDFNRFWLEEIETVGLKLSAGKNYVHPTRFCMNSEFYTLKSEAFFSTVNRTIRTRVKEVTSELKSDSEGNVTCTLSPVTEQYYHYKKAKFTKYLRKIERCTPLRVGLLIGEETKASKKGAAPCFSDQPGKARNLSLTEIQNLVVRGAVNPTRARKRFVHYQRLLIDRLTEKGKYNLYLPRERGGLGFFHESPEDVLITDFQRRFGKGTFDATLTDIGLGKNPNANRMRLVSDLDQRYRGIRVHEGKALTILLNEMDVQNKYEVRFREKVITPSPWSLPMLPIRDRPTMRVSAPSGKSLASFWRRYKNKKTRHNELGKLKKEELLTWPYKHVSYSLMISTRCEVHEPIMFNGDYWPMHRGLRPAVRMASYSYVERGSGVERPKLPKTVNSRPKSLPKPLDSLHDDGRVVAAAKRAKKKITEFIKFPCQDDRYVWRETYRHLRKSESQTTAKASLFNIMLSTMATPTKQDLVEPSPKEKAQEFALLQKLEDDFQTFLLGMDAMVESDVQVPGGLDVHIVHLEDAGLGHLE